MNKNLPESYTYPALFTKESDGGYSVRFPQLDGCFTEGDTLADAIKQAKEALSLHLFGMEEDGEAIPSADFDSVAPEKGEMLVPITVWMTLFRDSMNNRAVKKTISIPAWLNTAAERESVNFSQIMQSALKDYLGL